MEMEPIEGSETSAIINQTPWNYRKINLLYSVHGESLKSRLRVSVRFAIVSESCSQKGVHILCLILYTFVFADLIIH